MRRAALAAVAGAAAALLALAWTGSMEAEVGPGRVQIETSLTRAGHTTVQLPPLGRLSAATHRAPLALTATVLEVDIERAQLALAGSDPVATLEARMTEDLDGALRRFAVRTVGLSAGLGAVGGLLLPGRRWVDPVAGATAGALVVGVLLAATWAPYDRAAFDEPTFEGELVRVPGLLELAERNLDDLDAVRGRVDALSARLADLYATSAGEIPGGAPGETSILHVSDLHLNPIGAELVVQLAEDLDVDAVLDTGDVTSFGLAVEARFGELLAAAPVPYLVVPGNHDSPANRRQLAEIEGLTVIDGRVVEVGGVRILGVADPTFTATNEVSTAEAREVKVGRAADVGELVDAERPDVLAVHDRVLASGSTGRVALVVAGHLHERTDQVVDGTLVLTVGSTGATGLGELAVETQRPYEAQVLRFRDGDLVAIDYLRVRGIGGEFSLERRLVEPASRGS